MAHNDAHFAFLRVVYTVDSFAHVQRLPVRVDDPESLTTGVPLAAITVFRRGVGTPASMDTAIGQYLALLEDVYHTSVTIAAPELWGRQLLTEDFGWINVYSSGEVGVNSNATTPMSQAVLSFRTLGGNLARPTFMEAAGIPVNIVDPFPFSNAALDAIADYFISEDGSWVVGRDNLPLIAAMNMTTKTNDALRRKRALLGT